MQEDQIFAEIFFRKWSKIKMKLNTKQTVSKNTKFVKLQFFGPFNGLFGNAIVISFKFTAEKPELLYSQIVCQQTPIIIPI